MQIPRQHKTNQEFSAACRNSLDATTRSAMEAITFLARSRREMGQKFELPAMHVFPSKFVIEMMDLLDQGHTEHVEDQLRYHLTTQALEHANQGDN